MNCSSIVGISAVAEESADRYIYAEFFFNLAGEALFRGFSEFDLATREFPFPGMPDGWFPAGYKELVFMN